MWADEPAVYEATFSTIQAARGSKGGRKSSEARGATKREAVFNLIQEGNDEVFSETSSASK